MSEDSADVPKNVPNEAAKINRRTFLKRAAEAAAALGSAAVGIGIAKKMEPRTTQSNIPTPEPTPQPPFVVPGRGFDRVIDPGNSVELSKLTPEQQQIFKDRQKQAENIIKGFAKDKFGLPDPISPRTNNGVSVYLDSELYKYISEALKIQWQIRSLEPNIASANLFMIYDPETKDLAGYNIAMFPNTASPGVVSPNKFHGGSYLEKNALVDLAKKMLILPKNGLNLTEDQDNPNANMYKIYQYEFQNQRYILTEQGVFIKTTTLNPNYSLEQITELSK